MGKITENGRHDPSEKEEYGCGCERPHGCGPWVPPPPPPPERYGGMMRPAPEPGPPHKFGPCHDIGARVKRIREIVRSQVAPENPDDVLWLYHVRDGGDRLAIRYFENGCWYELSGADLNMILSALRIYGDEDVTLTLKVPDGVKTVLDDEEADTITVKKGSLVSVRAYGPGYEPFSAVLCIHRTQEVTLPLVNKCRLEVEPYTSVDGPVASAAVTVDGRSGRVAMVSPGKTMRITVSVDGWKSWAGDYTVDADGVYRVNLDECRPYQLNVITEPEDAIVTIDGVAVRSTELFIGDVVHVKASKDGWFGKSEDFSIDVSSPLRKTYVLDMQLEKNVVVRYENLKIRQAPGDLYMYGDVPASGGQLSFVLTATAVMKDGTSETVDLTLSDMTVWSSVADFLVGNGGGKFAVRENTVAFARKGLVTAALVKDGKKTLEADITVTQRAADVSWIELSVDRLEMPAAGGEATVTVSSNDSWEVS